MPSCPAAARHSPASPARRSHLVRSIKIDGCAARPDAISEALSEGITIVICGSECRELGSGSEDHEFAELDAITPELPSQRIERSLHGRSLGYGMAPAVCWHGKRVAPVSHHGRAAVASRCDLNRASPPRGHAGASTTVR